MNEYYDKYCKGFEIQHIQNLDANEKRPHRRKTICEKRNMCKRYKKGKLITVKPEGVFLCLYFLEKNKYELREIKLRKLISILK